MPFFQDGVNLVRAWLESRSDGGPRTETERDVEVGTDTETEIGGDGADPTETGSAADGDPTRSAQTDGGPRSDSRRR